MSSSIGTQRRPEAGRSVSVCMATYNGATYLLTQIESILSQLAEGDELLIADDGSTDGTLAILQQIQEVRVRFLGSQRLGSPLLTFERALRQAKGSYIFLADQDDVWVPNKLELVLPLLDRYDLVLTDCEVVNQQGVMIHPSFFAIRGSRPGFWYNLRRNSYMGCCMAFRRDVLDYALPFPPYIHMHDWWIGLLTEARGRVFFVPQPLLQYRRHGANASPTGEGGFSFWHQLVNRVTMGWAVIHRLVTTSF